MSVKLFRTDNEITELSGKKFAVGDFDNNEWISEENLKSELGVETVSKASNQSQVEAAITAGASIIIIQTGYTGNLDLSNAPTGTTFIIDKSAQSVVCASETNPIRIIGKSVFFDTSSGAKVNLTNSVINEVLTNQEVSFNGCFIGRFNASAGNSVIDLTASRVTSMSVNGAISGVIFRSEIGTTTGAGGSAEFTGSITDSSLGHCFSAVQLLINGVDVKNTITSYFGTGRKFVTLS